MTRFNPCETEECKNRCDSHFSDCEEIAADEIERLRAEIEVLRAPWVSRRLLPNGGRVLAFSPAYKIGDPMRYRVLDAGFISLTIDVTYWLYLEDIAPNENL